MGKIKLYYFNLRGRAELSRLILAQGGADYEDTRIEKEDWPKLKPTIPGGQLPALEVDGVKLSQSVTIARFLANKYKLTGSTPLEQAQADMVVDCVMDLFNEIANVFFEKDETKKKERKEKMKNEIIPAFFKQMTTILTNNGGQYMVGKELTWADIAVSMIIEMMSNPALLEPDPTLMTNCPELGDLIRYVHGQPRIQAWMEKRPKTDL